ncbi:MAG TPA: PilN domain-containing protein [Pseudomonas sp.]|nr:PilN domain-containing protein [Pseudomonas sp.]
MTTGVAMQNLNLYQVERAPGAGRPAPRLLALGALLLLGLILVDGGWHYWRLGQLQARSGQAQEAARQAEAELAQARLNFREPQPDPQLPRRLAELEAANRQLQQLAQHLQLLLRERSAGFRAPLDALAERHVAGLWLSGIRFEQGGSQLLLEGASQSPELLPDYLGSLGRSPAFAGRQFARFDLDRDEQGVLRFRLASQATDPQEGKR